jgi:hypothetical protein
MDVWDNPATTVAAVGGNGSDGLLEQEIKTDRKTMARTDKIKIFFMKPSAYF